MNRYFKKLFISFLITALGITGCSDTAGRNESGSAAGQEASSQAVEDIDSDDDNEPEEGTTASEYDWIKKQFNGVSFWIPSTWEVEESDSSLMICDTKSPDYVLLDYYVDMDISTEEREDPVLFDAAIFESDIFSRYDYVQSKITMIGDQCAEKVMVNYSEGDNSYQGTVYYIPVGDYGIVVASFIHVTDVDNKSDRSCLEMTISTLEIDYESLPEDSYDIGVTQLGVLPVELINNDELTMTATSVTENGISIKLVNKSENDINVSLYNLSFNGYMLDGIFIYEHSGSSIDTTIYTIDAGTENSIILTANDMDDYSIKDIGRVGMKFRYTDDNYNSIYKSDYILFDTVPDYDEEAYESYFASDEIVYQDENVIVTYEGIEDGAPCLGVKNLKNEMIEVRGSRTSIDGEYVSSSVQSDLYMGTFCILKIEGANALAGSELQIAFTIRTTGSLYGTDIYSVNL